jgi:hypothetical protein
MPSKRAAALFLIAISAIALVLVACGDNDAGGSSDTVEGVITHVESKGLDNVTSFELRSEGTTYEIFIDPDIEYGFRLGHLHAHLVGAEPVVVKLDDRNGKLFALTIEDA